MPFFNFLSRMIEGKPVFEDVNKSSNPFNAKSEMIRPASQDKQDVERAIIHKGVENSFPVVYIKHVTTHVNDDSMEIYGQIVNNWPEEIMLDKVRICGAMREIDDFLRGGQEKEFLVYKGQKLKQQYYEAQLDYKTKREGDYFESIHNVTFLYHSQDGSYTVNEIRLHLPIRDIYG